MTLKQKKINKKNIMLNMLIKQRELSILPPQGICIDIQVNDVKIK